MGRVALFPGHASASVCGGEAAGEKAADISTQEGNRSMLVMSGGEGYIDFRMGERGPGGGADSPSDRHGHGGIRVCVCLGDEDGDADESEDAPMKLQAKAERSHLIVWQLMTGED